MCRTKLKRRRRRKEFMNNLDFSLFPPINWRWSLGRTCLVADVMINTTGILLLVLVPGRGRLHREKLLLPLGQGQVSLRPLLRPPPGRGDRAWIRPTTLRRRAAKVFTHRGETSTPTIDRRSGRSNFAALGCNRGRCWRTLIIILIIPDLQTPFLPLSLSRFNTFSLSAFFLAMLLSNLRTFSTILSMVAFNSSKSCWSWIPLCFILCS